MTKNPFFNALGAGLYITLIATFMFYGKALFSGPDTVFMPMAMLSLLVLSVAVMGTLFFYQPIRLYVEGEKLAAIKLLLQTLGIFAGVTILFILLMLL